MARAKACVPLLASYGLGLFVHSRYSQISSRERFTDDQSYLATSVDVEQTFSQGRLLLSHIHNRLSVQSTQALLCLGVWSEMGYVRDQDVKAATILPEVEQGDEDEDLPDDWDAI